jgi:hypothetical protein
MKLSYKIYHPVGICIPAATRRLPAMPCERRDQRTGESDFRMRVRFRAI